MDDFVNKMKLINIENKELLPMIYDIVRTITIQIVAQFMYSMNNPSEPFLTLGFFQTTLFLCLGIMVFWLIIFKLMSDFLYKEEKDN